MMHRKHFLQVLGSLCLSGAAVAQSAEKQLPLSSSLPEELAKALKSRQPLVVMISLYGCPWCKMVRENYLAPMHVREGLAVVQIDMQSPRPTQTPAGASTTHGAMVREWGVKLAPTLLFLGPGGREVAERLPGGSSDFYGAYLDERLSQARRAILQ
ncbi:thioredoxin family protein [Ottowia thiooxydans]|uniref:Thioredoxin-related protein n=1 Tax=Ottowia thiooxydans TaxID=219182 RepID=A0ABV2QDX4_9BURK